MAYEKLHAQISVSGDMTQMITRFMWYMVYGNVKEMNYTKQEVL